MRRDPRGPWYLITGLVIGLVIGVGIAVLVGWWLYPVDFTNTRPASLRADFKDQYRALIASAYMANSDLLRAKARLDLLKDPDPYRVLSEQAQRTLAEERYPNEARALGLLAIAVGQPPPTVPVSPQSQTQTPGSTGLPASLPSATGPIPYTGTPGLRFTVSPGATLSGAAVATATLTRPPATLAPTFTPLPTRTATPTQGAPFILESENLVCDPSLGEPQIQVVVKDAAGEQVPGMQVIVIWDGGEDRFFTGLKPELGLGYADFNMQPGIAYTLRLAAGGQAVPSLVAMECQASDGSRYLGSWRLVFVQP